MKSIFLSMLAIFTAAVIGVPVVSASEDDVRAEEKIRNSYVFKTYLKDNNVDVVANNGVVTLRGTVDDDHERSLVYNVVESIPGVTKVDNQLLIKDELPAEDTDAWISVKIKAALLVHRNVSGTQTRVIVKDGVVTLYGEAENQAQKDLTAEYAKDIKGVKNVVNNITIVKAGQAAKKNGGDLDEIDDASITAQVKGALFAHRSTSALRTSVETREGVVTLKGKAKNDAEKALVTKLVNDIKGVKGVDNKMDVI